MTEEGSRGNKKYSQFSTETTLFENRERVFGDDGESGTGTTRHNVHDDDEAKLLPQRFDAIQHRGLPEESPRFLVNLTVDAHGLPRHGNHRAGIDGFSVLRPAP